MKKGMGWALQGKMDEWEFYANKVDNGANREPTRLDRRRQERKIKKLLAKSGK